MAEAASTSPLARSSSPSVIAQRSEVDLRGRAF